jgi:pimeloyl-ACP methyl ester carboxylesterase
MDDVVLRCLAKNPRDRLQAHEVSRALAAILQEFEAEGARHTADFPLRVSSGVEQPPVSLPISFAATRDGVTIAYTSLGSGPVMVHVRGWVSHLQHFWADEQYRHFVEELARDHTVVRYDTRGNGLSERVKDIVGLDPLIEDLDTIVNAATGSKVVLFATCFGGPIAIEWARRHPERVAGLILDGTFLKGRDLVSRTRRLLLRRAFVAFPEAAFLVLTYLSNPSAVGRGYRNPGVVRDMISPRTAAALYDVAFSIDVEHSARQLAAPTLVLHTIGSTAVPIALGREVAMAIRGAAFVELPGDGINPWDHDPRTYAGLLRSFVQRAVGYSE